MDKSQYQQYLASPRWGEKRKVVRGRSSQLCERCYGAEQTATHHLTYERVGSEDFDDLLGVCERCHLFLSGLDGSFTAANRLGRIYLAGKIAQNDWRHELFPGLRGAEDFDGPPARWGFDYAGPYFISDDHGLQHGPGTP